MAKLITIIILATVCRSRAGKYESNYEAFTIGVGLKVGALLCLGECFNGRCVYDWHGDETDCRTSNNPTKKYTTKDNQVCVSNCDKYDKESYEWCVTAHDNWDKCSRTIALEAKLRHTTKNEYKTCDDDCDKYGKDYYWCNTIKGWEYCHIDDKALVPNYPTTADTTCETPCKFYDSDYKAYCYDNSGSWERCFLNPRYEHVLHNITEQLRRSFRFGIYDSDGYKLCKKVSERAVKENLHFNECDLSIEAIARRHRADNPTTVVRTIDPDVPIYNLVNPILSYTTLPRVGRFDQTLPTGDVDLPLVLEARLTVYTTLPAGTPRESFPSYVTNNYNRMNPNSRLSTDNFDERGHLLAARLGGPMEMYNIIPQTWRLNRGCGSSWFEMEQHISNFLQDNTDRYVDFLAVVSYRNDVSGELNPRPDNIGVRLRFYDNNNLTDRQGTRLNSFEDNETENMLFSNDPNQDCCRRV